MRVLLTTLFLLCFLSACGSGGGSSNPEPPVRERIVLAGVGDLGIFDPSVERDPVTDRLWMSYSSIETSIFHPATIYWAVSIRLAFSDNDGVSWQDAGVVVSPVVQTLVGPLTEAHPTADIPALSEGIWQSETSSLIYDPGAPAAERWKLIWSQYLNANLTSFFADYGWIAMKTAASPTALAAVTPIKLFGGVGLQPQNILIGAPTFAPIGAAPLIQLNTEITQTVGAANLAELAACVFAEPGLHASAGAVYLAIYCADASSIPSTGKVTEYVVYFRCNSPCDMTMAGSWEYVGRLLTPADAAAATGDDYFQAPALVEKAGNTYLIVTSVDNPTANDRYNGCRVYLFTNINSILLDRSAGMLVEQTRVDGDAGSHHGACDDHIGMDGGILLSQFGTAGTADAFQIFKSQVSLP